MKIDLETAQNEIDELRALLEESYIKTDLAEADREEWKARAKILENMLARKNQDITADYQIAEVL